MSKIKKVTLTYAERGLAAGEVTIVEERLNFTVIVFERADRTFLQIPQSELEGLYLSRTDRKKIAENQWTVPWAVATLSIRSLEQDLIAVALTYPEFSSITDYIMKKAGTKNKKNDMWLIQEDLIRKKGGVWSI